MQFEAVLASAESKGDAPSRFELRSNPATDEVVFYVSPDPALPQKPRDYSHATRGGNRCATRARPAVDARCPFCPGNEKLCNADLATVTTDGAWTARAFENAFPIFHALDGATGAGDRLAARGAGDRLAARGAMEVLVAARGHNEGLADLSPAAAGELVTLARDRFNALAARRGARSVRVFQNHGARAGASISHAHWQCVALGFVPPNALRRAAAQARGDACPVHALMDAPETLVWEDANARAFAVVAPRSGTVWVAPRRRRARIGELTDAECRSLGAGLRTVARAMDAAWDDPDFNLVAHSAALGATERFQAYFEVAPHRREDASLGTLQYDVPISHLSPEQCATELKFIELSEPQALDPHGPVARPVQVHHHHRLPLAQHQRTVHNRNRLRAAQQHAPKVRVRVDRLLVAPPLQFLFIINIPPIFQTSLSFVLRVGPRVDVVVFIEDILICTNKRPVVRRGELQQPRPHVPHQSRLPLVDRDGRRRVHAHDVDAALLQF